MNGATAGSVPELEPDMNGKEEVEGLVLGLTVQTAPTVNATSRCVDPGFVDALACALTKLSLDLIAIIAEYGMSLHVNVMSVSCVRIVSGACRS